MGDNRCVYVKSAACCVSTAGAESLQVTLQQLDAYMNVKLPPRADTQTLRMEDH